VPALTFRTNTRYLDPHTGIHYLTTEEGKFRSRKGKRGPYSKVHFPPEDLDPKVLRRLEEFKP